MEILIIKRAINPPPLGRSCRLYFFDCIAAEMIYLLKVPVVTFAVSVGRSFRLSPVCKAWAHSQTRIFRIFVHHDRAAAALGGWGQDDYRDGNDSIRA